MRRAGVLRPPSVKPVGQLPHVMQQMMIRRAEALSQDGLHRGIRAFPRIPDEIGAQPRQQSQWQDHQDDEQDRGAALEHARGT